MTTIKKICLEGLLIRLIVLIIILIFSDNLTTGFLRSTYISDDLRYIDGAVIYSETATSIIDIEAFGAAYVAVGDYVGDESRLQLWYWIMCILMYIFKYPVIVKIINIILGVLCIAYIYKLCLRVYPKKKKIAILAAKLYAFFPYPVFFCCFLYKDQFLTLITLAIFYIACAPRSQFSLVRLLKITALLLIFSFIRSGLVPILLVSIGLIEINKSTIKLSTKPIRVLVISLVTITVAYYMYVSFANTILYKLEAYTGSRASDSVYEGTTIRYFLINNIYDIWKLPFAYAFTIIQPLYIGGKIVNWESIVAILNVCNIPIVIVNVLYIFMKKSNKIFWISIMLLYAVMLFVSMGISRHFYYLLPYTFIFYADAIYSRNEIINTVNKASMAISACIAILIIPFLGVS